MKFRKITTRIMFTVLPVVFIATTSMALLSYYVFKNRIETETGLEKQIWLQNEASRIKYELNNAVAIANAMARYAEIGNKNAFVSGSFKKYMAAILPTDTGIVGSGIWLEPYALFPDQENFSIYYDRKSDGYDLGHLYLNYSDDYRDTCWYTAGQKADHDFTWSEVVYDEVSGLNLLRGTQPFYDDNDRFWGNCTIDINVDVIKNIVLDNKSNANEHVLLVSARGNYVFSSYKERPANVSIINDPNPALVGLGREVLLNQSGESRVFRHDKWYRVYYQPIAGVGWKIMLAVPEEQIFAPIKSFMATMLLITVIALLSMSLMVLYIAGYLHKIINKINLLSTLAAAGHLDERINVNTEDEFGAIAANLNFMMENMAHMAQAKSDFLSRMSHEIRTPMNAIIGMTQIGRGTGDCAKRSECLQRIEENSNHLLGIINDILDYSKIESGKLVLDAYWISLRQNMDFIYSMMKSRADEKGLDFTLKLENIEHDAVETDALRLNQVLINFLSNAIKFTNAGGKIELSVTELLTVGAESVYRFAVSDTGIGIEPEHVQKLFTPFSQASAQISTSFGGTGLGLAISKNIVEMMGGQIELDTASGQGSVFSFTIRVKAQKELKAGLKTANDATAQTEAYDFSNYRILIVDDIEINRVIAQELLEDTGVKIECAENGREAADMFLSSPKGYYDMIFMDMLMPVMDGCSATGVIRESGRGDARTVKIIAMTANVLQEDVERVFAAGMDRHIAKPIDISEVLNVMHDLLS